MQFDVIVCFCLTFLLSWAALSSYWKHGVDMHWWNWFLHGFFVGLSFAPMIYLGIHWYWILLRAFILGATMMWWSETNDNAVKEEFGRGFLIVATLPILFL